MKKMRDYDLKTFDIWATGKYGGNAPNAMANGKNQ
jgi:hypothetical protein